MTFSFRTANAWAPVQSVIHHADTLLARAAEQNAAAAVHVEAARRIGWRCEESEFLVMTDAAEVYQARRSRPA